MSRPTIIAYHGLGECAWERDPHRLFLPVANFEAQMAFLAEHRTVVSLDEAVGGVKTTKPAVAITFDDGYRGVLTLAAPILARYGFPATCFVPTNWIGKHNSWDPFSPDDCRLDVMTEEELHELERLGVSVESHAHMHANLAAMSEEDAFEDLETAQRIYREVMGRPARYLAYPYGRSAPPSLCSAARRAGFTAAFTINRPSGNSPFSSERVNIRRHDGLRFFALKTSGRYLALRHSWMGRTAYRAARPLVGGNSTTADV